MLLKNLLRRRGRTLLTLAGISIGVAAIVALSALADGLGQGYSAMSGGSGADLLVAQADAVDVVFSAVDEEIGSTLSGLPGVARVAKMVYTLAATEGVPYFIVFGYEPDNFAVDHFRLIEGEGLAARSARRAGRPLLLGHTAADDLGKQVGDTLQLYETTFRIVGIYETGAPFEDRAAVVRLEDAQSLSGYPRQVNAFLLKLEPGTDLEALRGRIENRFDDLTASGSADFVDQQETLAYVRAFTWSVSLLALLIGGIGVMNTLLMSVFERTREFGTLRALGWRRGRVLGLVLRESLALSALGGLLGIGIGVGVAEAVERMPAGGGFLTAVFTPGGLAQGLLVALALGLLGGAYPAWRASRLPPAEAMRAESGGGSARGFRFGGAAVRNLSRQPARTLLTMAGIAIAVTAMVDLGALGNGMVDQMNGMAGKGGAHLVGMQANASIDLSNIDEGVVRRVAAMPGVRNADGFLTGYATLGELPFFVVFGYLPRGQGVQDFTIVEGQPLSTNRQIVLGRVAAENLGRGVGDTLRIFNTSFRVTGIYETGVSFEDGGGVISLHDAQALFGQPHKVSFMNVWLEDPGQAQAVAEAIEARFPEVALSQTSEFAEDVGDLQLMRAGTWGIAFLALLVGGAGMTNTMIMSVFERTREIGVLRALGWSGRRVVCMVLGESVALSLLGSAAGVLLGLALMVALNAVPLVAGFVRMRFDPGLFAQALLTALVLGAAGGVYPAWRAARLQPVEALRYE